MAAVGDMLKVYYDGLKASGLPDDIVAGAVLEMNKRLLDKALANVPSAQPGKR